MLAGLEPGTVLGGFWIEERLGAGGMAVVFRARDETLDRVVALKVLAPALTADEEFRERFIRESRAAALVDHPHIIPVHASGEADTVLYLAMRYVPGGDLRSLISREGWLTAERTAALLRPIASALDAAHAAGLVHRDVKPANILIDANPWGPDHPYLSDFGLAKGATATSGLTETGHFLGTPHYSSPEQIGGEPVGPQSDQYALACVAYTMLTGALPFARESTVAVLWAHMHDSAPSVRAHRADLPPGIDAVLAKALAKAPGERYASCGEFAGALCSALGLAPSPSPAPSPPPPAQQQPHPSTAVASVAGLPPVAAPGEEPTSDIPQAVRPAQPLSGATFLLGRRLPGQRHGGAPGASPVRRLPRRRTVYLVLPLAMVACLSGGWWLTLGQHGPPAGKARPEPTVSHAPTVHVVTTPSSAGGTLPSAKIPVVTGTDCSGAQLALQQAGLTNISLQVHPFDSGTATGTNPPAGQTVPAATPVTLSCGNIPAY